MNNARVTVLLAAASIFAGNLLQGRVTQAGPSFEKELRPPVMIKGEKGYDILERMKHYRVQGVSLAVIRDSRIALVKTYGVKEAGKSDPVTPETMFQAASISKPVTAAAVLRLVEEGKLSLDREANDYLKSWKIPAGQDGGGESASLRHLLTHRAGLSPAGFNGYPEGYPIPGLRHVLEGKFPANSQAVRPASAPGRQYRYSGAGYVVLQAILSDVEGRLFDDICAEKVFQPAGMNRSTFVQPLDPARQAVAATGHLLNGMPVPGGNRVYPELAAAGLWTTPADLALFFIDLGKSYENGTGKILSQAMAREMVVPASSDGMGMGLIVTPGKKSKYVEHGGLNEGFKCRMVANLDAGYGAVVMTNGERGAELTDEILRGIALAEAWIEFLPAEITPVPADEVRLSDYSGTYEAGPLTAVRCEERSERLVAVESWGEDTPLFPVSKDVFLAASGSIRIRFLRDGQGRVISLERGSGPAGERLSKSLGDNLTAVELVMRGDMKGAAALLESGRIKKDEASAPAWVEVDDLAYRILRRGYFEEAKRLFSFNAEMHPEISVCQYGLADFFLKTGTLDEAREQFRKTIETGRKFAEANAPFAGLLQRAEDQLKMLK